MLTGYFHGAVRTISSTDGYVSTAFNTGFTVKIGTAMFLYKDFDVRNRALIQYKDAVLPVLEIPLWR